MGYTKNKMIETDETKLSHNVKECTRCFTLISEEEYEENNGLCNYCMNQLEKLQKE